MGVQEGAKETCNRDACFGSLPPPSSPLLQQCRLAVSQVIVTFTTSKNSPKRSDFRRISYPLSNCLLID